MRWNLIDLLQALGSTRKSYLDRIKELEVAVEKVPEGEKLDNGKIWEIAQKLPEFAQIEANNATARKQLEEDLKRETETVQQQFQAYRTKVTVSKVVANQIEGMKPLKDERYSTYLEDTNQEILYKYPLWQALEGEQPLAERMIAMNEDGTAKVDTLGAKITLASVTAAAFPKRFVAVKADNPAGDSGLGGGVGSGKKGKYKTKEEINNSDMTEFEKAKAIAAL